MSTGQKRNLITIEEWVEGYDVAGQPNNEWTELAKAWAKIVHLRGQERWAAAQVQAESTITLEIRYVESLDDKLRKGLDKIRGKMGTRVFDITGFRDPDERKRSLHLDVKERL